MFKHFALMTASLLTSLSALATPASCEAFAASWASQMSQQAQSVPAPTRVSLLRDFKRGQNSPLLPLLRESLGLSPDGRFDDEMVEAVKSYQGQLGFTQTGVIDPHTFVNILPLSAKYQAAAAAGTAAECHRIQEQLSRTRPAKFIEVNLAAQELVAYEYDTATGKSTEVLRSRVVVGAVNTKTPLEDFSLWGLKFNPGWTPTTNILARNVVKGGTVNRRWLAGHHMKVTDSAGKQVGADQVNASNWRQFRYSEPAGAHAALGVLKFETTSGQNIYMHDTPEKSKFSWNQRLASSGCVRVQEIDSLARWAFGATEDNESAQATFDKHLANSKNTVRRLAAPIPVFITYRLMDFTEEGEGHFYADGYARMNVPLSVDYAGPGAR